MQLVAPARIPAEANYQVQISDLGKTTLSTAGPERVIKPPQETAFFPTDYRPVQAAQPGSPMAVEPSTPTNFEKIDNGWTVRLNAKPLGKLVVISGVADHVESRAVPAGYGAVAGPIYQGETLVTPNVMEMAKTQTTTTRFQIFAIPGESYEVTLYRGDKAEKHQISVGLE